MSCSCRTDKKAWPASQLGPAYVQVSVCCLFFFLVFLVLSVLAQFIISRIRRCAHFCTIVGHRGHCRSSAWFWFRPPTLPVLCGPSWCRSFPPSISFSPSFPLFFCCAPNPPQRHGKFGNFGLHRVERVKQINDTICWPRNPPKNNLLLQRRQDGP